jgi:hypothetical protein
MSEKEKVEIHETEYINKELPRIAYEKTKQDDMTHGSQIKIDVSDTTGKGAFKIFRRVLNELGDAEK